MFSWWVRMLSILMLVSAMATNLAAPKTYKLITRPKKVDMTEWPYTLHCKTVRNLDPYAAEAVFGSNLLLNSPTTCAVCTPDNYVRGLLEADWSVSVKAPNVPSNVNLVLEFSSTRTTDWAHMKRHSVDKLVFRKLTWVRILTTRASQY